MLLNGAFLLFRTRIISKCVFGTAQARQQAFRNRELSLMAWQNFRLAAWNGLRNSPGLFEAKSGHVERKSTRSQIYVAALLSTLLSFSLSKWPSLNVLTRAYLSTQEDTDLTCRLHGYCGQLAFPNTCSCACVRINSQTCPTQPMRRQTWFR